MFKSYSIISYFLAIIFQLGSCTPGADWSVPYLSLSSPGELEYSDVVVRRVDEELSLLCRVHGDSAPRDHVWNYIPDNATLPSPLPGTVEPTTPTTSSRLTVPRLQQSHSGRYMCSAPPFSASKYVLVQPRGGVMCTRGAFWCGRACVLAAYVCDGWPDCRGGEDEAPALCPPQLCQRSDKLNCSSGRCIAAAACCRPARAPSRPACCREHRLCRNEYGEDFPALFEDRHAPDEYGFIQSTIYTVTACALIFMIAVVLLVSALCRLHMKRSALRPHRRQPASFPPRYETTHLMPLDSPTTPLQCVSEPLQCEPNSEEGPEGFGLAGLSAVFGTRYRQVPTAAPRPADDVPRGDSRPLTLQLGRFHLSIPGLAGRADTPVATARELEPLQGGLGGLQGGLEAQWDTYTLNGRTVRLLGAHIQPCPVPRPPPYDHAYKMAGPPPQYLSRDELNTNNVEPTTEQRATSNVELPPCYDELTETAEAVPDTTELVPITPEARPNTTELVTITAEAPNTTEATVTELNSNVINLNSIIDNLPAIDSDVNANEETRFNDVNEVDNVNNN